MVTQSCAFLLMFKHLRLSDERKMRLWFEVGSWKENAFPVILNCCSIIMEYLKKSPNFVLIIKI